MVSFFFLNDTPPTKIYTLSLHDALPIGGRPAMMRATCSTTAAVARSPVLGTAPPTCGVSRRPGADQSGRSEEHTSELQSRQYLVCRLLLAQNLFKHTNALQFHTTLVCLN